MAAHGSEEVRQDGEVAAHPSRHIQKGGSMAELTEHKIYARILVYGYKSHTAERVVYLRTGMEVDFAVRWRWWFEYLAALVKVHHPHRKVELSVGQQTVLLGEEWKAERTRNLLKDRRARLKRLEGEVVAPVDLFGFAEQAHEDKIAKCREDIRRLEAGTYHIPDFPDYRNEIKDCVKEVER